MQEIGLTLVGLSLLIWLWLLCWRGQFWRSDVVLEQENSEAGTAAPTICAVIPARNEADMLPFTLSSLLQQTYAGTLQVILVDDQSSDGTAAVAVQTAAALEKSEQLQVVQGRALPAGWSGKLWAMQQGVAVAEQFQPDYLLFTDADIQHHPLNVQRLVNRAVAQDLDLASVMVRLRCESVWEQLLIPAFVFFFEKLYPFRWVNDPDQSTAAAAGGSILIRSTALERIGGLQTIRQALIDDCALAQAVKGKQEGKIWLGLSDQTVSLRPYPSLKTIWNMIARTAFTQLGYSLILLIGTVLGMFLIYLAPIISISIGLATGDRRLLVLGLVEWLLMALVYLPTIRFYRCQPVLALSLPLVALLYTLMTIDSALRYWQGRGGAWKGRVYSGQG